MAGKQQKGPPFLQPPLPKGARPTNAVAASATVAHFSVNLQRCLASNGGSLKVSQLQNSWLAVNGEPLVPEQYGASSVPALLAQVRPLEYLTRCVS